MEHFAKEIEDLHTFFEQYFLGDLPENEISQFEATLADGFTIIPASGAIIGREAILNAVRGGHDKREEMRIWIEDVVVRQKIGDTAIVTYEEWQTLEGVTTKRTSTVVFQADESRPNGVIWLHVHESGLRTVE